MQQHISFALAAIFGMLFLEGHTICKATWYTLKKYRKDPQMYGLNQWNGTYYCHRPVLLLHGAVGSWSYLGDLAITLRNANIPMFVIDLGFGLPTEEIRRKIFNKIEEIRRLYSNSDGKIDDDFYAVQNERQTLNIIQEEASTRKLIRASHGDEITRTASNSTNSNIIPFADIVAHSNDGTIALYSTFTEDCSYIDEQSNLKFRSALQANPHIGKVIPIALPSNQIETNWMREINKINDLFNINTKYDALMSYKKSALIEELPSHVEYIDAGHIGIVFNRATHNRILQILLK